MTEQQTPSSERGARQIILETVEAAILPAMHQRRQYDSFSGELAQRAL